MKIYTAATFKEQSRIQLMRDELFRRGHNVLSTWLNEQVKPNGMTQEEFGKKMAMKDLQEVAEADCLILDRFEPSLSGGKMIEFGFALAKHKLLYVVDPDFPNPASIFLQLADKVFPDWEALLVWFDEHHSG